MTIDSGNDLYDHVVQVQGDQALPNGQPIPGTGTTDVQNQNQAQNNAKAKAAAGQIQTGMQNAMGQVNQATQNSMSSFNTIFQMNLPQTQAPTMKSAAPDLNVYSNLTSPDAIMQTPVVTSDRRAKMNIQPAVNQTRLFLDQLSKIYGFE